MREETLQAARRAWANDPEAAAQALLGCSAEELFITALRGCNQHKHKPGCPDADTGGSDKAGDKDNKKMTTTAKTKMLSGATAAILDPKTETFLGFHQLTADEAEAVVLWGQMGVNKSGHLWFLNDSKRYVLGDKALAVIAE